MADQPKFLDQLNNLCEEYLVKKAPALPENVKEAIVKYGPYVILVLVILALPGILFALGLGAIAAPLSFLGGVGSGVGLSVGIIISTVALVIELIALPGLFKRTASSWKLVYYSTLVSAVSNLVSFNLGGLIIGTLISLYILFQIKSYYK